MNGMDLLYRCLECGVEEIVKAKEHMKDGRSCKKCKGHLSPQYYVGIDLARNFSESTRGQKIEKILTYGRTGNREDKTEISSM
jgi:hypothetical protein